VVAITEGEPAGIEEAAEGQTQDVAEALRLRGRLVCGWHHGPLVLEVTVKNP
jgi:hypothetical protein